jgi:hypothetical protein
VKVLQAKVQVVDPDKGIDKTFNGDLNFAYLIVVQGASLAPEMMQGFSQPALTPTTWKGQLS